MMSAIINSEITRRDFLQSSTVLAAATLMGLPKFAAAEPPPETTKIRLVKGPFLCFAPLYLAEALLHLEGFTEVDYIPVDYTLPGTLVKSADLSIFGGPSILPAIDAGMPLTVIAGLHVGCWELFGNERVKSVTGLNGKKVAISGIGGVEHIWLSSILAYVGMDPRTDINWVPTGKIAESQRRFLAGEVDAFLAFPPQPHDVRVAGVGQVIVNTTMDRPWSQYFCCILGANQQFLRQNPIAAKRALRALLKATDICANEPERVARFLGEKGYEPRYDVALEVLKSLPYNRWRHDDPEDTIRFHALRLHEVGMIKTSPNKLIAQGTDWRFLNEIKRELKA
jgi:NitT/TauT family transport system substrate-binding protein